MATGPAPTLLRVTHPQPIHPGQPPCCQPTSPTWNRYISPLRMLLSTVPPKMYMASEITAAAWKSLPLGSWVERGVETVSNPDQYFSEPRSAHL